MPITLSGTTGISGVDGTTGIPALQGNDADSGIVFGTDTVSLSIAGSQRATVDSLGRLLVGVTAARSNYAGFAPYVQFEQGTGNSQRTFAFTHNAASSNGPIVFLGKTRGTTVGSSTSVVSGDEVGQLVFSGADGTNMLQAAVIRGYVDGTPATNGMPGRLTFATTGAGSSVPTERLWLTSEGLLGLGANPVSGTARFTVLGVNTTLGTAKFSSPKGANESHIHYGTNGDWYIRPATNTGSIYVKNYVAESDARLKENIADSGYGLDCILSLRPRSFTWIDGDDSEHIGFVAQEVEQVAPSFVSEGQWKSVSYQAITSTLVKALQEATVRLEALEARNADLTARLTALEANS